MPQAQIVDRKFKNTIHVKKTPFCLTMSITIATLIVSLLFRRLVMSNIRHFNSHRVELDHDMNWLYLVFLFDAVLHGWLTAAPAAPLPVLVTCACVWVLELWRSKQVSLLLYDGRMMMMRMIPSGRLLSQAVGRAVWLHESVRVSWLAKWSH